MKAIQLNLFDNLIESKKRNANLIADISHARPEPKTMRVATVADVKFRKKSCKK